MLSLFRKPDYKRKARRDRCANPHHRLTVLWLGLLFAPAVWTAGLPDTIDKVRPSIVAVGIYQPSGSPRQQFRGTGFVVGNGHLVVTNFHVLPEELKNDKKEQLAVYSGRGRQARIMDLFLQQVSQNLLDQPRDPICP